jgi:hypothetical protein
LHYTTVRERPIFSQAAVAGGIGLEGVVADADVVVAGGVGEDDYSPVDASVDRQRLLWKESLTGTPHAMV